MDNLIEFQHVSKIYKGGKVAVEDVNLSFEKGEFIWNAKPRFGKTLAAYDLTKRLKAKKVLIVTNRPAIANSWYDDFKKIIDWSRKI